MDWLEVSVATDSGGAEAVAELMDRYCRGRAVIETPVDCFEHDLPAASVSWPVIVKTYLPLDDSAAEVRRCLEGELLDLGQVYSIADPTVRTLAERDWTEAWREQYDLQRIGRRTVIVPAWEDHEPVGHELVISLEPGMAFGTGLHPTTRQCLVMMEEGFVQGCTVLDVGTGSGVLAIAAAKVGARSGLALDADPMAVQVASQNVLANAVDSRVRVEHRSLAGSVRDGLLPQRFGGNGVLPLPVLEDGHFDLVTVNILAHVIIGMAPALAGRLTQGGRLVAAGIVDDQEIEVTDALRAAGLIVSERSQDGDWVCLVAEQRYSLC